MKTKIYSALFFFSIGCLTMALVNIGTKDNRGKTRIPQKGPMIHALQSNFQLSDINLKENIRDVENSLEKFQNLRPIIYDYKPIVKQLYAIPESKIDSIASASGVDPQVIREQVRIPVPEMQTMYGLIAQEVQSKFPYLVKEYESGYLSVNYVGMIPLIIKSIQEQQAQIEDLKRQLNAVLIHEQ